MGFLGRLLLAVLLILILWVSYIAYTLSSSPPKIRASWGPVDENRTTIFINASLRGPPLVPASVENARVSFMGLPVGRVESFHYSPFSSSMSVVLALDNRELVKAFARYLENGEEGELRVLVVPKFLGLLSAEFNVSVGVRERVLEKIRLSAESQSLGGLPLVKTPALLDTNVSYLGTEGDSMVFRTRLVLYNPNPFPLPVLKTSYRVRVNGFELALGSSEETVIIPPKARSSVTLVTYLNSSMLPAVWASHVRNGEKSTVDADLYLRLKIEALGVSAVRDVKLTTVRKTVETDLMSEINGKLRGINNP